MTNDTTDPVEAVARAICKARHGEVWNLLSPEEVDFMYADARAAIAAYREALEATGWQIVPKEPTATMLQAGTEMGLESGAWSEQLYGHIPENSPFHAEVEALYHAIRRAAPSPDTDQ